MTGITDLENVSTHKSAEPRVASLKQRHATLENALDNESNRPMPDVATISHLKREKLAIKDELERLTHI